MLTLSDCQSSRFQNASGFGTSSDDFLEILNDAVTELIRRGDWYETVKPICVKLTNRGEVTWPRFVGEVRKIQSCREGTIEMRNVWWRFIDSKNHHAGWEGWCTGERNCEFQYKAPTYNDIPGTGNVIQFFVDVPQDVGAQCTIFGVDDNGQRLQTLNGDGTWTPGITITAVLPYGVSTVNVSKIERVICTKTNSTKRLYSLNTASNSQLDLAVYGATETNPSYLRYRLTGGQNWASSCSSTCQQNVIALVKLAAVPIQNPQDLVIINSRGALLDAIKAIKAEDSSSPERASELWASAIKKLNLQLSDDSPDDVFAASDNTWGDSRTLYNRCF